MQDFRMQTFLTVCRTMNYTRAAEELNITQPAVSKHIRYLEEAYGVRLFSQQGKRLSLTPQGAMLKDAAVTIAHDGTALRLRMAGAARRLRLGCTLTAGEYVAALPVARYLRSRANASLKLTVADTGLLLGELERGEIDCALVEGFFAKHQYDSIVCRREPFVAVCAPGFPLPGGPCTLSRLRDRHLLLREPGSGTRAVLEHALAVHNLSLEDFPHRSEISSINIIKILAGQGCGVAFLYQAAVEAELESGLLRAVPLAPGELIPHDFTFLWRRGSIFAEEYRRLFEELFPNAEAQTCPR